MRSSKWSCPAPFPAYFRSHFLAAARQVRNSPEEPGNEVLYITSAIQVLIPFTPCTSRRNIVVHSFCEPRLFMAMEEQPSGWMVIDKALTLQQEDLPRTWTSAFTPSVAQETFGHVHNIIDYQPILWLLQYFCTHPPANVLQSFSGGYFTSCFPTSSDNCSLQMSLILFAGCVPGPRICVHSKESSGNWRVHALSKDQRGRSALVWKIKIMNCEYRVRIVGGNV